MALRARPAALARPSWFGAPMVLVGFVGLVATAALVAGCGEALSAESSTSQAGRADIAEVVKVVDGDTVELDFDGTVERVRLLGIDAPESVHPSMPVQCFGVEASAGLAGLLAPGTEVRVERDIEARDRYDRLLLYLYRADDEIFVNRWLVGNGLADTSFYEPNTARSTELTRARAAARAGSTGLWGHCDGPDQPLE